MCNGSHTKPQETKVVSVATVAPAVAPLAYGTSFVPMMTMPMPMASEMSPTALGKRSYEADDDDDDCDEAAKRQRVLSGDLSDTGDDKELRKARNRMSAQASRDRKKNYIQTLEQNVSLLTALNKELNTNLQVATTQLSMVKSELENMKSIVMSLRLGPQQSLVMPSYQMPAVMPEAPVETAMTSMVMPQTQSAPAVPMNLKSAFAGYHMAPQESKTEDLLLSSDQLSFDGIDL